MFQNQSLTLNRLCKKFLTQYCTVTSVSLCILASGFSFQSYAEDEVFLASLKGDSIESVKNISNRIGYDNQPHFTPDSTGLLYSAMFERKADSSQQTDSMYYDIESGRSQNLTNSNASEYSPTITPDGQHFSMIRVGEDGRQLLWKYSFAPFSEIGGANRTSLMPNVYDVGYHVWLNKSDLLLFMLGDTMTLQRASVNTGKLTLVDSNIGRTLRKVPNKDLYSYTKKVKKHWLVKLYNPQNHRVKNSVLLSGENMYYAWHQDGRLLSANNNQVQSINAQLFGDKWKTYLDFSEYCQGDITRMVMSNNAKYFAFVCQTPEK